jgi:hypothetical protein
LHGLVPEQFLKIHKIRLEITDLLAHIEGACLLGGHCAKKNFLYVLPGNRRGREARVIEGIVLSIQLESYRAAD